MSGLIQSSLYPKGYQVRSSTLSTAQGSSPPYLAQPHTTISSYKQKSHTKAHTKTYPWRHTRSLPKSLPDVHFVLVSQPPVQQEIMKQSSICLACQPMNILPSQVASHLEVTHRALSPPRTQQIVKGRPFPLLTANISRAAKSIRLLLFNCLTLHTYIRTLCSTNLHNHHQPTNQKPWQASPRKALPSTNVMPSPLIQNPATASNVSQTQSPPQSLISAV
ncbi:hypothetical protein V8C44DRAFT_333387 [Trichoderma aethiopicum]